jgi:predicted metalloprotease with PDZ domain
MYSVGFIVKDDGTLLDVSPDTPAGKAGLAPGMKLVNINGRSWSSDALPDAIATTKTSATPLELLVENGSFQQTYKLDYRGGERYPHLERDAARPDLLGEIIKPRAH